MLRDNFNVRFGELVYNDLYKPKDAKKEDQISKWLVDAERKQCPQLYAPNTTDMEVLLKLAITLTDGLVGAPSCSLNNFQEVLSCASSLTRSQQYFFLYNLGLVNSLCAYFKSKNDSNHYSVWTVSVEYFKFYRNNVTSLYNYYSQRAESFCNQRPMVEFLLSQIVLLPSCYSSNFWKYQIVFMYCSFWRLSHLAITVTTLL